MRILVVTANMPWPLDQGSRLRTYNLVKQLSKAHEVTLLSLVRDKSQEAGIPHLRRFCKTVETIYAPRTLRTKARDLLLALTKSVPYTVQANTDKRLSIRAKEIIEKQGIDLVQLQELYVANNILPLKLSHPLVLDAHNRESLILEMLAQTSKNVASQFIHSAEAKKMHRFEEQVARKSAGILAVSQSEQSYFSKLNANTMLLPNGVEEISAESKRAPKQLLFTGTLEYPPNRLGLTWFLEEIWPGILSVDPAFQLIIVARHPSTELRRFTSSQVRFVTDVEDIRPYLSSATLTVVPLQAGAGSRLKILEAFAAGLPVVSTSIGVEGIDAKDEEHLLVRNDPVKFAEAVITLAADQQLRNRLSLSAGELIRQRYLWSNLVQEALPLYSRITS